MKLENVNGQLAKIHKSSMTIYDDNGKTAGVIRGLNELMPRDSSAIWGKVRKAVGLDATNCIAKMRKIGGEIVYLENINTPDDNAGKLQEAGIFIVKYRKLA